MRKHRSNVGTGNETKRRARPPTLQRTKFSTARTQDEGVADHNDRKTTAAGDAEDGWSVKVAHESQICYEVAEGATKNVSADERPVRAQAIRIRQMSQGAGPPFSM